MEANTLLKSVGQLAVEMPGSIAVMEKWKMDYCCHGDQDLAEACRNAGVTVKELMEAIDAAPGEARNWDGETMNSLQKFIVETHHRFTRDTIDTLGQLSKKVADVHGANHPEMIVVASLVKELEHDLLPHMLKEEQVLFPYIESMEKAVKNGEVPQMPFFGTVRNPVRMMLQEHETVAEKMMALRSITRDYSLPDDACLTFRALYDQLSALEKDLHRHIHLENNVLFPRATAMEGEARSEGPSAIYGEHCCTQ